MRIGSNRAEIFLQRPPKTIKAFLIYGPDEGLVRERVNFLAQRIVGDIRDIFQVSELTAEILQKEPYRLAEEAATSCLVGDVRLVHIFCSELRMTLSSAGI